MKNIKVLFEKIIPEGYKKLTYYVLNNQSIKITDKQEYFESIIDENDNELLSNDEEQTGELIYNYPNTIIPGKMEYFNIYVKFKSNIFYFLQCFANCSNLYNIPENLFDNNIDALSFDGVFSGCWGLKSIPQKLFSKNKKANVFAYCFSGCSAITGEVPIDENGIKLYERTSENGYVNDIIGTNCFTGCLNLSDYSEIPDNWK